MSEEEEPKVDGEGAREEESSDDYDEPIPMDEDPEMSYLECFRAFCDRQGEWEVVDILKLVWMIRLCMAPVFGFVSGFCRIPTVVGQILFVWLCSKIPTMIIVCFCFYSRIIAISNNWIKFLFVFTCRSMNQHIVALFYS